MLYIHKFIYLLIITLLSNSTIAADDPIIAVASNMSHAFTDIAASFQKETNIRPKLTFGSSGNFARQIIQGAPFKLFLSADKKYVDLLRKNGIKLLADIEYARGRIGLFVPNGSRLSEQKELKSVIKKLFHGKYNRLVIANPEHAPYGLAAQRALQSAGLWVVEKKRLLLAENAAQTTQIAISGNVDVGIIPASHAYLPELEGKGKFFLIPEQWHQPLQQHLVLLNGANSSETKFFQYLQNEKSQLILKNYGYTLESLRGPGRAYGLAGP